MPCCAKKTGFTLIEVLIALAVIGVSLAAVGGEMVQMLNTANKMQDQTYASWIAHNKIAEMRLANVVPDVSVSSGEVTYADRDWAWRAVVSETGVENLYRVDVSVSYPGRRTFAPACNRIYWRASAAWPEQSCLEPHAGVPRCAWRA